MQKHPALPETFAELGVEPRFLRALATMGFTAPTEIQRAMIPAALQGRDILGQARTGTGKTAAFSLPTLQRMTPGCRFQTLCLVPTRELAVQVAAEVRRLARYSDIHCVPVYGGQKISTQVHYLGRKPGFVVGTPGRVMDFMGRGVLDFGELRVAILDEVDRMLDIGFRDDIKHILSRIAKPHQTIFASATIDGEIRKLVDRFGNDPVEINVSQDRLTVDEVDQFYVSVEPYDKFRMLRIVLREEQPKLALVFTNTKAGARKLTQKLHQIGVNAKVIHGDLVQNKREKVMDKFRRHQIPVLVATDLAARGIDVTGISHIINYNMPFEAQVYVHRIGRTARMGAGGKALSFVTSEEGKQLTEVEKLINQLIPEQTYADFRPRPPMARLDTEQPAAAPGLARLRAPVFADARAGTAGTPAAPPVKTLGSKFRTRRRRRI